MTTVIAIQVQRPGQILMALIGGKLAVFKTIRSPTLFEAAGVWSSGARLQRGGAQHPDGQWFKE